MPMIVVDKVTKYYGAVAAARDLDFKIEEGECVGFLGLNGAGKSTTLKMLACLLLPTSGRVTIKGLDAEGEPHEIRKQLGFLPDTPPVYGDMTVGEYLRFAGQIRQMSAAEVKKRLPEVLEVCALRDVEGQVIGTLSHGYRQRVGIAQAIIHRPALLILDEPIQGLDPVQIVEMREMIRSLRGKHTILLSTHILSEVEQTCDRFLVLHEGRIAAQGTERELAERMDESAAVEVEARAPEKDGLRTSASAPSHMRSALAKVDGVLGAEATGPDKDGVVRATVRCRADVREAIARALVEEGYGLRRLERVSTGLEGIFVKVTESGEGKRRSKKEAA